LASLCWGQERLQKGDEKQRGVAVEETEEKYFGNQRVFVLSVGAVVLAVILYDEYNIIE